MPLFRYKALDARGQLVDGQLEAADSAQVIAQLQQQGKLAVEAHRADEQRWNVDGWRRWRRGPAFGVELQVQFTQQLATLLASGQPLERALSLLLDLPDAAPARQVIADIREVIRGGAPLSVALERQGGVFSRLYLNMVRAGEAGGDLQHTLQRLAEYLAHSQQLRTRVINALIYPAILLSVVGVAMLFLLGYVVPQFAVMYESLDVALPWFTRATLVVGLFVRDYAWLLVPALLLAGGWGVRRWRSPAAREVFDGWVIRQRLVGPMLVRLETARFARTLGTLLGNGVPLLAALGIASTVIENRVLSADAATAADGVKSGHALGHALASGGRFPRLALQMIQVGEESGALDEMLLRVADMFDTQTRSAIDRMLAALVPAITLLLATVVGVVIVTVLVPLYDLTNAIG